MSDDSPFRETVNRNILGDFNIRDEYKHLDYEELQDVYMNDTFPFQSIFINLSGELNIGNMIRTCCLSGCKKVHVFGRRKYDRRGTTGAHKYIPVNRINGFIGNSMEFDADEFIGIIQSENLYPIFIEQGETELQDFDWPQVYNKTLNLNKSICLIVGNEENGVPDSIFNAMTLNNVDHDIVSIPQKGVMRSFNVSIALGIVIWDMRKELGWI